MRMHASITFVTLAEIIIQRLLGLRLPTLIQINRPGVIQDLLRFVANAPPEELLRRINAGWRRFRYLAVMRNPTELFSARVPRYTSYPTAPHFDAGIRADTYREWLRAIPDAMPLSLYLHIPFCDTLCWFCGCHTKVVHNYAPVAGYVDLLLQELDMVADALGAKRRVSHIHWGGGSPTMLVPADIQKLSKRIHDRFSVESDAEFAIEVDPRGLADETVDALKQAGVTRVSIGVQDCDETVQKAINRIQPFAVTEGAVHRFRQAGITAINIDLIYGLPHQTCDKLAQTIQACLTLEPQRFAIFGYAHVPHFKKHQALIPEAALPGVEERLAQFELAQRLLNAGGYRSIGLDHFAKANDPLEQAQATGTLNRNFQGYTTDSAGALIGLGLSSISSLPQGYTQNHTDFSAYRDAVRTAKLPISRGIALSKDDRLRAAVIAKLMCNLTVDLSEITAEFGVSPDYFAGELEDLRDLVGEGLVSIMGDVIKVPDSARIAVRLVCAAFDAYLVKPTLHAIAV